MERTKEFYAFYDSVLSRRLKNEGYASTKNTVRRWPPNNNPKKVIKTGKYLSTTAQVAEDINSCKIKLGSLLKYVNRRTLFDDQPAKINELISIIKKDLEHIGGGVLASSKIMNDNTDVDLGQPGTQTRQHAKNVLIYIETDFSKLREEFKRILDIRSQNLNEQRLRKQEYFYYSPDNSSINKYQSVSIGKQNLDPIKSPPSLRERLKPGSRNNSQLIGKPYDVTSNDNNTSPLIRTEHSSHLLQQMKAPSKPSLDLEISESKSKEIDLIEATVIELGQMYQNFSNMVSLQGQSIRRVDDNLNDVELNVSRAHAQLAKYYKSISSNKWLIIKVLAVLLFFFIIFIIFT